MSEERDPNYYHTIPELLKMYDVTLQEIAEFLDNEKIRVEVAVDTNCLHTLFYNKDHIVQGMTAFEAICNGLHIVKTKLTK